MTKGLFELYPRSWLVLGHGRTGAIFIIDYIKQFYKKMLNKTLNPTIIFNNSNAKAIGSLDICHSTDIRALKYCVPHTKIVISTRNPIDSIISHYILDVFKFRPHQMNKDDEAAQLFVDRYSSTELPIYDYIIKYHVENRKYFLNNIELYKNRNDIIFIDYENYIDSDKKHEFFHLSEYNYVPTYKKILDYERIFSNYDQLKSRIEYFWNDHS